MNARENIKPKTIRLAILLALADGAITTIDDLQIRMDEPRKKVVDNAVHAANDDLIKRLRDDVTGGPAYQITPKGREHLASFAGGKAEVAAQSPAAESDEVDEQASRRIARAVDLSSVTPCVKTDFPAFHEPTASAIIGAMAFGYQGSNEPPAGHWLTEFHQRGAADARKDAEIAQAIANRESSERMFQAACADLGLINEHLGLDPNDGGADPIIGAIKEIEGKLNFAESRLFRMALMLRNSSAEALSSEESIELLLAKVLHKVAHQHDPVGYVAASSGKPLARFTKAANAQARAMSAARGGKRAQVFALVPVGAAVPGAEWVEAE